VTHCQCESRDVPECVHVGHSWLNIRARQTLGTGEELRSPACPHSAGVVVVRYTHYGDVGSDRTQYVLQHHMLTGQKAAGFRLHTPLPLRTLKSTHTTYVQYATRAPDARTGSLWWQRLDSLTTSRKPCVELALLPP
jgi:hypothetical protein